MASGSIWQLTPRQSIEAECVRRGRDALVEGCIAILQGRADQVDDALIFALGGTAAQRVLTGEYRGDGAMWQRVWATRGLLWAWEDRATAALELALTDDAWRVREMAAKVARRYLVGEALPAVAALQADPVQRVRDAATDAVEQIVTAQA